MAVDSFFGSNHKFLDAISKRYHYFADIRSGTLVWTGRPRVGIPPYKGRGPYPKKRIPLEEMIRVSAKRWTIEQLFKEGKR